MKGARRLEEGDGSQPYTGGYAERAEDLSSIFSVIPKKLRQGTNADSFDKLLVYILWENLHTKKAEELLTHGAEGAPQLSIPVEVREIDGEYVLFCPILQDWKYIRRPPQSGDHSMIAETYREQRVIRDSVGLFKGDVFEYFGMFLNDKKFGTDRSQVPIGSDGFSFGTPYHILDITSHGITLRLQRNPTLIQYKKLLPLIGRFEALGLPLTIVEDGEVGGELSEEHFAETLREIEFSTMADYELIEFPEPLNIDMGVLDDGSIVMQRIIVKEAKAGPHIFGVGVVRVQLDEGFCRNAVADVELVFHPHAVNHNTARNALMFDELIRRTAMREYSNPREVYDRFMAAMENEERLTITPEQFGSSLKTDLLETLTPFKLSIEGYQIRYGVRALYDLEKKEVVLELLIPFAYQNDRGRMELVEKLASRLVHSLEDQDSIGQSRSLRFPVESVRYKITHIYQEPTS